MAAIASRPSVKLTDKTIGSGTLCASLLGSTGCASVGTAPAIVVEVIESSADASSARRTLYDQMRQAIRKRGSQICGLIIPRHW